jgi:hypothetical protein
LDSPNYANYSERELHQVLTRIDADRFPERVAEVHEHLAKFSDLKTQHPPFGATGPQVSIWKPPATASKKMYAHFALAAVVCILALIFQNHWRDLIPIAGVIALGGPMMLAWESRYQRKIYDFGEGFLIKDFDLEVYVGLTQIHYVTAMTHEDGQYEVTLEIVFETKLGARINFFPTPEAVTAAGTSSYTEYLKQRIQGAKNSISSSSENL